MEQRPSREHFLVETSWLAEHLQDPDIRIVDMRGYVRTVIDDQATGHQVAHYVGHLKSISKGISLARSILIGHVIL